MNSKKKIDLSVQRRRYYSNDCGLTNCPECGKTLIKEGCSIVMWVKSDKEDMELMTSLSGSHFCQNCPAVVFDIDVLEQAVMIGLKGAENISYSVRGIVDFDAIPKEKRHLEIGIEENPTPMVPFLPEISTK